MDKLKKEILSQYDESTSYNGDVNFCEEWENECSNLLNQIDFRIEECQTAAAKEEEKIVEFCDWRTKEFPDGIRYTEKEKELFDIKRKVLLKDLGNSTGIKNRSLYKQCRSNLKSTINHIFTQANEEYEKFRNEEQKSKIMGIEIFGMNLSQDAFTTSDTGKVVGKPQVNIEPGSEENEKKWCLTKYQSGSVNVEFRYGKISFPLLCKK